MPSNVPWTPTYDFATDASAQNLVNAAALQGQFDAIAGALSDLQASLGVSIRDDDTLSDLIVASRNLSQEVTDYIDSAISGSVATQALSYFKPVRVAAFINIASLSGTPTIDGVVMVAGDRVLVTAQVVPSQNGLWVVASGAWARATDLPAAARSGEGWAVFATVGTVNAGTIWAISAGGGALNQPLVGTDALTFVNVFGARPVAISRGGTGQTNAASALVALGGTRRYVTTIVGDGVSNVFVITHSLGMDPAIVSIKHANGALSTYFISPSEIATIRSNIVTATITFVVPLANSASYNVIVIG